MLMEDYNIQLRYLEGERNVLADCFSRVPRMDKPTVGDRELEMIQKQKGTVINWEQMKLSPLHDDIFLTETSIESFLASDNEHRIAIWDTTKLPSVNHNVKECYEAALYDDELNECLMNLPTLQEMDNPATMINIRNHQQADAELLQALQNNAN